MKYLFALLGLVLLYFHTRGLYYPDDGYVLNSALRTVNGQIPYKDFHFAYTPLSMYLDAFSFKLLGVTILASRLIAAFLSLLTCVVIYKIARYISSQFFVQLLPVIFYVAWGPSHSNFIFPTPLAITTGLLTCLFILNKRYFWAGVFTVLTFLSKQNFGIVLVLNSFFVFLFLKMNKTAFLKQYMIGLLIPAVLFVLYLHNTGSFSGFLNDFQTYVVKRIVAEKTLSTSFFYGFSFFDILKSVLYLSPFFISAAGFAMSFKSNKHLLFLSTFCALYYIFGIRPTTDYIHLTPLLSITGIPALIVINKLKGKQWKRTAYMFSVLFIALGFYTALFRQYYRWNPRLWENNYFVAQTNIRIFAFDNDLGKLSRLIRERTKPGEYIFVNFYSPMIYFAVDRQNPTKFDLIEPGMFYAPYQKEIIQDIEKNNVRIIVTQPQSKGTYLSSYIEKNFRQTGCCGNFTLWEKNK